MYYYKLIVAYDGYDYHGWQYQPHKITIAGILEKAFIKAFKRKPASLVGASRTDAGVHAWGQAVKLKIDFYIDPLLLKRAWQGTLPSTIMVRDAIVIAHDFDIHSQVITKVYDYYISNVRIVPFLARYCATYYREFDKDILSDAMKVFVGEHDFRSFCTGDDKESTVRTITETSVFHYKRYGLYRIRIKGPGFLRYMVRRIVGASLQAMIMQLDGDIDNAHDFLKDILSQKNPKQHLKTAPAHGLILRSIIYRNMI